MYSQRRTETFSTARRNGRGGEILILHAVNSCEARVQSSYWQQPSTRSSRVIPSPLFTGSWNLSKMLSQAQMTSPYQWMGSPCEREPPSTLANKVRTPAHTLTGRQTPASRFLAGRHGLETTPKRGLFVRSLCETPDSTGGRYCGARSGCLWAVLAVSREVRTMFRDTWRYRS